MQNIRCCAATNNDVLSFLAADVKANVRSYMAMRRDVPLKVLQQL